MKTRIRRMLVALIMLGPAMLLPAQSVPPLLNYQGRVAVGGVNFNGNNGKFKFALVDAAGTMTYWSNDGTSSGGNEPANPVTLTVVNGLYSVLLGDDNLGMGPIPSTVFNNADVRLRVWFNDSAGHGSQLLAPDQRIAPVGYALVADGVRIGGVTSTMIAAGAVNSAQLAAGAVQSSNLATGAAAANLSSSGQTGVASGGLVLSATENAALVAAGYIRIGTTTTADAWQQRTNGAAPSARNGHTAVWTGSEMIVWGGFGSSNFLNNGARYNPAGNSWTAMGSIGAPSSRRYHTAVWTGTEMIVWGGENLGFLNDGARYNPTDNSWSLILNNLANTPSARESHTAVWTGSEMIVWGGYNGGQLSDGSRYNPAGNNWTTVTATNAPSARNSHTAVWTGGEMIVWGGYSGTVALNDTFNYTPGRVLYLYQSP